MGKKEIYDIEFFGLALFSPRPQLSVPLSGIGGWISNMVGRNRGAPGATSSQYRRLEQGEGDAHTALMRIRASTFAAPFMA
jgi:hypothetical protein